MNVKIVYSQTEIDFGILIHQAIFIYIKLFYCLDRGVVFHFTNKAKAEMDWIQLATKEKIVS